MSNQSIKLQTTQPQENSDFRAEDYRSASEKVLNQLHRSKLEAIAELFGLEDMERFEVRGDIVKAILEAREEQANG